MNLRKLAQGQECQVRVPNVCNFDPETTVLAHIRIGNPGMGRKPSDLCGVWACSACHEWIDRTGLDSPEWAEYVLDALCRTLTEYERIGLRMKG